MTTINFSPIVNQPFLYLNGMQISNDATTPNTKVDVAAGQCRDSLNDIDIIISSPIVIDTGTVGVNGLDTGVLQASKVYYVYAIADASGYNASGYIMSLSATQPVMPKGVSPSGYSSFRLIGCMVTDASVHFLLGYWAGRNFYFDATQATAITAGAATSYTAVDLSALVPNSDNLPVFLRTIFTPNAANDKLSLQPTGATGDAIILNGQVASVPLYTFSTVLAKLSSSLPKISYKVSTASAAVAINVAGFTMIV